MYRHFFAQRKLLKTLHLFLLKDQESKLVQLPCWGCTFWLLRSSWGRILVAVLNITRWSNSFIKLLYNCTHTVALGATRIDISYNVDLSQVPCSIWTFVMFCLILWWGRTQVGKQKNLKCKNWVSQSCWRKGLTDSVSWSPDLLRTHKMQPGE